MRLKKLLNSFPFFHLRYVYNNPLFYLNHITSQLNYVIFLIKSQVFSCRCKFLLFLEQGFNEILRIKTLEVICLFPNADVFYRYR